MFTIKVIHIHRTEDETGTPVSMWDKVFSFFNSLTLKIDQMAKTQAELAADLRALNAQVEKSKQEILDKTAQLETAIQNAGNVTPEVEEALANLKSSVQSVDDLNADAPAGGEGEGNGGDNTGNEQP